MPVLPRPTTAPVQPAAPAPAPAATSQATSALLVFVPVQLFASGSVQPMVAGASIIEDKHNKQFVCMFYDDRKTAIFAHVRLNFNDDIGSFQFEKLTFLIAAFERNFITCARCGRAAAVYVDGEFFWSVVPLGIPQCCRIVCIHFHVLRFQW
jgi:hypothetical protein